MPPKGAKVPSKGIKAVKAMLVKRKEQEALDAKLEEEQREKEEELRRLVEEQRRIEEAEEKKRKEEEQAELLRREREQKALEKKAVKLRRLNINEEEINERRRLNKEMPSKPSKPKPKPKPKEEPKEDSDLDDWEKEVQSEEEEKKEPELIKGKTVAPKLGTLRSPICCVMGHVDAGKTSLLDRIRGSNIAAGEAGHITQQVGATFIPNENLVRDTAGSQKNPHLACELNLPGLLLIDTPGHETFYNLRSRGTSLCDIAIVVVNLRGSIEQTTRESLRMLRERRIPFIIAFNKVDTITSWKSYPDLDFETELSKQSAIAQSEFFDLFEDLRREYNKFRDSGCRTANDFANNVEALELMPLELYWRNPEPRQIVSVVPTSATNGDGVNDLLLLMSKLVQQYMGTKVSHKNTFTCTILEKNNVEGHGMTIDVILVNGSLAVGDEIALCGTNEIFKTKIRYILTPQPMQELRTKMDYVRHDRIYAAMGAKLVAERLPEAIAGRPLILLNKEMTFESAKVILEKEQANILVEHKFEQVGVVVNSSSEGAKEALLKFLQDNKIAVSAAHIGPVYYRHVQQAIAIKDKDEKYGAILAYDVEIDAEAEAAAKAQNIPIFRNGVLYKLEEEFQSYFNDIVKEEMNKIRVKAIFPVLLRIEEKILSGQTTILKVQVLRGNLYKGTPLGTMVNGTLVHIGVVRNIRTVDADAKDVELGRRSFSYTIEIANTKSIFGRHYTEENEIFSVLTRPGIDAVKNFGSELDQDSVNLLASLAKLLKIPRPSGS